MGNVNTFIFHRTHLSRLIIGIDEEPGAYRGSIRPVTSHRSFGRVPYVGRLSHVPQGIKRLRVSHHMTMVRSL